MLTIVLDDNFFTASRCLSHEKLALLLKLLRISSANILDFKVLEYFEIIPDVVSYMAKLVATKSASDSEGCFNPPRESRLIYAL